MRRIIIATLTVLVLFTFSSCNWDVWQNSVIDYGNGNGNVTATLNFVGDAPKYAWATKASYPDKIVITWNGVTGADYYEIYRSEDLATPEWKKLTTSAVKTTTYTDTKVEAGKTYLYEVRARSFSNLALIGEFSNTAYGNTLTPPMSFTASQGESSKVIHLSWSSVENVKGYKVYWSLSGYGGTWNVLIPNGMQATDYTFSSNTTEGSFVPDKQNKGSYIYFYIVSISNSNVESSASVQRIGYTYVEGAPTAPKNFTASRGTSTTEITLSWDAMYPRGDSTLSYDWDIYRSAEGQSELLIYSTKDGSAQPEVQDGKMTYTDNTSLEAGIEYTYKIIAIGDVTQEDGTTVTANGKPSTAEGFLLSPPSKISSKKIANGGFEFVFEDALGAQENPTWFYSVYGKASESDTWSILSDYAIIEIDPSGKYTIQTTYNTTSDHPEDHYQYFTVVTNTSNLSSKRYDEVYDKNGFYIASPSSVDSFTASDNTVFSGTTAVNGSYPVCLTMTKDSAVSYYIVRIWTTAVTDANAEGYTEKTFESKDISSLNKSTTLLKDVITTPIGQTYYFAVNGKDELGRESGWSKVDSGYSAITGATLIKYMQIYCFKPWEHLDSSYLTTDYPYKDKDVNTKWKNSEIYSKISQAGLGSLSDGITENSYFHNGTIFYKAVRDGVGGAVTFSYSNFGEVEWMSCSGSYTMNVSMSGDGTVTNKGGLTIKGMYPANIGMGNLKVKSQSFTGTYTVTQENGLSEEVSPSQE
jgi:hypothetical protein